MTDDLRDELPADLDPSIFVGPYQFPDNSRRRWPGVLYLVFYALGRTQRAAPAAGSNLRRAGVAVVMLAWAFALPAMGFLASSAIAFVLLLMLANHERWTMRTVLLYGATGVLVLGGLYALFKHALQVPLP